MKKTAFAAAIAATMLLVGCGKSTDMPKKYKEFLDYTFGGNYTAEETEDSGDHHTWSVTYTDASGKERTVDLYSSVIDEDDKEIFGSQEVFDESEIFSFSVLQISDIVADEFYERFVEGRFYFDTPDHLHGLITKNYKDETMGLGVVSPGFRRNSKYLEYMRQQVSTEDGMKISEYDLKQAALDPYMSIFFSITLDSSADPQECTEKMEEIYSEFMEYTGSPQNYRFSLKQKTDDEGGEIVQLFSKTVILGEEIDEEAMNKDGSKFLYSSELQKRLFGEEN